MSEFDEACIELRGMNRKLKGFKIYDIIRDWLEEDSYQNKLTQAHIVNEILYRHYTNQNPQPDAVEIISKGRIDDVMEISAVDTSEIIVDTKELEDWEQIKNEIIYYQATLEQTAETIASMDLDRIKYLYNKYGTLEIIDQLKENYGDGDIEEDENIIIDRIKTDTKLKEVLEEAEEKNDNLSKVMDDDESEKNPAEKNKGFYTDEDIEKMKLEMKLKEAEELDV